MPRTKKLKHGTPESAVLAQTLEALRIYGIEAERHNVGMAVNAKGRPVRFGQPGDSDVRATIPRGPHRGKLLTIETKRGGFDPRRVSGAKAKEHWAEQLEKMRKTIADGGIAFWVNDGEQVMRTLPRILEGAVVEIDEDGFPWIVSEEE